MTDLAPDAVTRGGDAEPNPGRLPYGAGAVAGLIAGTVMSMAMMLLAVLAGESIWGMPNMIGAMWFGGSMGEDLGVQAVVGMLTHEVTSTLMGVVAVPFVSAVPRGRVLPISIAYALASYPLLFSLVMSWANPMMFEQAGMVEETWAHLLFGTVFAVSYLLLTRLRRPD